MVSMQLRLVFALTILHYTVSQRRIIDGKQLGTEKRYMVYLVPKEDSGRNYDNWICGGAILHPFFVLTSAACIEDVEKVYVVAGYDKYVKLSDLENNECTKNMKRKVISTYTALTYELDYNKLDKWSSQDIAVVKVDKQYHFDDTSFTKYCSYPPNKINVNFDKMNERPGMRALVLGWGHTESWRTEKDKQDYNVNRLLYGSTIIYPKNECKNYFTKPNLSNIIEKYMICTNGYGQLNDSGSTNLYHEYEAETVPMKWEYLDRDYFDKTKEKYSNPNAENRAKKSGICQNDHGGPLIAWIDKIETVLGVASMFRVDENLECVPPFLFTSTYRHKNLIECLIKQNVERSGCPQLKDAENYKILYRRINWNEQSDSASNGTIQKRPQISLSLFQG